MRGTFFDGEQEMRAAGRPHVAGWQTAEPSVVGAGRRHARGFLFGARLVAGAIVAALVSLTLGTSSAAAAATGFIQGKVTEAAAPHEGIEGIEACPLVIEEVFEGYEAYVPAGACAKTSEEGNYKIAGLAEGQYFVGFLAPEGLNYLTTFYERGTEGTTNPVRATEVTVTSGTGTTGIDVEMVKGGAVEGTVHSAATGAPVAGVEVCALEEVSAEEVYEVECTESDAGGGYQLTRIAGEYELAYFSFGGGYIEPQFWDGALSFDEATPIEVESEESLTLEPMDLQLGGSIAGTVTNASIEKEPVAGMFVCAEAVGGESGECEFTDGAGQYTISGLRSGSYVVEFTGFDCEAITCKKEFTSQFYDDASAYLAATFVNVTAPQTTGGIDASTLEAFPVKPTNLDPPALSGIGAVGQTLTCSQGAWAGNPTSIVYSWLLDGAAIAGQAGASYVVPSGAVEHQIACEVTVTNAAGSASAASVAVEIPQRPQSEPPPHQSEPSPHQSELPPHQSEPSPHQSELPPHQSEPSPHHHTTKGVANLSGTPKYRSGAAVIALRCVGETKCKGRLKLVAKAKRTKRVRRNGKVLVKHVTVSETVGSAKFKLAAGGQEQIAVHLSAKGAALLSRHGSMRLQLSGSDVKRARFLLVGASVSKQHGSRAALRRSFVARRWGSLSAVTGSRATRAPLR